MIPMPKIENVITELQIFLTFENKEWDFEMSVSHKHELVSHSA